MTIETRLRRLESAARRIEDDRIEQEIRRLLDQASPDGLMLFSVYLERSLRDDGRQTPETLVKLEKGEAWLERRESEEPGFTRRIEAELSEIGILE